ncbi:hypothetical protein JCGZ_01698 [Jatropha curcas]|uniref:Uncharacterized protein n=1 Tax=Jatropha curcas TaxID=180498 RepID=A0A067JTZ2_JATCU|nr:hypothetical protein JCGZ_01698 [Jatropha curcas]
MGRDPTPIEVFKYTHIKDHDLETFVDRRAPENAKHATVDELQLYWEAVGVEKKRKVYRIGSQAAHYYAHSSCAAERQLVDFREHVMRISGPPASRDPHASSDAPASSVIVLADDSTAMPTLDTSQDTSNPPV